MMARATDRPSMLALVGDMSGPSLWRVLQPFTMLQRQRYPAAWDFKDAPGIGAVAPAFDGYVLARMSWQPGARHIAELWFETMRRWGKLCVYDADDDIFTDWLSQRVVELDWADGKTMHQLDDERAERVWTLQQCDGVTVSTQRLATIVRQYTDKPVVVVPNAIDIAWFRRVLRSATRQTRGLTIGWAGGKRPDRDLEMMADAWARIAQRYADVTFVVAGHRPACVVERVPADRLVLLPWRSIEHYPESYAGLDIVCCSVSDEPFNRAKSAIKAYEAAVAGAAVVASPTLYGALLSHGVNGYIADSVEQWTDALAQLIESPATRSMMAKRLLRVVEREHSLAGQLWRWPAAWRAIAEAKRGVDVVA